MAEFKEIIRQKERMCISYTDCDLCPLYIFDCCSDIPSTSEVEKYENTIMEWAKENPEISNKDKLYQVVKEAFGEEVGEKIAFNMNYAYGCDYIKCPKSVACEDCGFKGFWIKPYVEPKGETK